MNKKIRRLKRAAKTRLRISLKDNLRLVVHRTNCHIYASLIEGGYTLATVSTLSKEIRNAVKNTGNIEAANMVGVAMANKIKAIKGNKKLCFDRSGFLYHGRVKAIADAIRENGIQL